ncbi:MAG: DEAD/DEAH box helicase [Candidatus Micrarchaeota archaeon]|nr:DEAD/DEAH box helicase [Candidatus Micrarchaeota archaeon]
MLSQKLDSLFRSRFSSYTPVQEKAIPVILSGADTLIIAPTGSGKTEAALLPILDRISSSAVPAPICLLYITPLRSLNRDMVERVRAWSHELGLRTSVRHGDTSQRERTFQSKHPPHVLITTPETLQAMLGTASFRAHLQNLRHVIIDELHELIGSKRGAQLSLALSRLRALSSFQAVAISATLTSPKSAAEFVFRGRWSLVQEAAPKDIRIEVMRAEGATEEARLAHMCRIISQSLENSKTLVFTNTRYMAELIGSHLISMGASVGVHHGSLSKEEREAIEDDFKQNKVRGLVCTSSLELGIDIGDVNLVIHIGSPKQVRKALQRIGRSGHAFGGAPHGIIISHNEFDFCEAEVISARAKSHQLEDDDIIYPSLGVLGHAVAGELLARGQAVDTELYSQLACETPIYSSIGVDEFRLLLSELHRNGVLFYDGRNVRKTKRTREFYFTRLSTIPTSIKYGMRFNGRMIGYLDERFVLSLNEGDVFITRGTPWRVLSIEKGIVEVEHSPSYILAIPDWEGEQIPVKREICSDVKARLGFGTKPKVCTFGDMLIIYTFLGSTANNALALALASRLTAYFGAGAVAKSSPYAVFIKLPYPVSKESLAKLCSGMSVENEIAAILHKNSTFSYLFSQEAYYYGFSREHERYSPYYISRLAAHLPYKEACDYFMHRYCDCAGAQELVSRHLSSTDGFDFEVLHGLDHLALSALDYMSGSQVLFPDIPEGAAMVLLDKMPSTFKFICANCGNVFYGHISSLPKSCGKCSSVLLAPSRENERKELSKAELMRRASLYISYGRRALIALSTYGVGTETAARVLSRMHRDEHSLALDLLRAREQFIRTKKYWSPGK